MRILTHAGRTLAAAGLVLGFVGAGVGSTAGAATLPLSCNAVGTAVHSIDAATDTVTWTITGRGDCDGDWQGPHYLDFTGTGTSHGLGTCTSDGMVQGLTLHVTGTLESTANGAVRPIDQTWSASQAIFPGPASFSIAGSDTGFGTLVSRIFGKCPPDGTVSTRYSLTFLT